MTSSSPSGQTTITQNRDPWSGAQPALRQGLDRATAQADVPVEQFPGSTVVPFSPQTEQGLQAQENRALSGSPLNFGAQKQITDTLGGKYLNAENPAFGAMADRIGNRIEPRLAQQFSSAGRYGSPLHQQMFSREMADAMAPLQFQNYSQERGNQMQAAQFAPDLAREDYMDIGQLQAVGAAREGQAGAQLQEQIGRFNFDQQEPRSRTAELMALAGGGNLGGSTATTSPIYTNPLATGLGSAATIANIGGTLFSPESGIFPTFGR